MKRLCRFYCVDCDNAWIELVSEKQETPDFVDKCEFCKRPQKAEEIE